MTAPPTTRVGVKRGAPLGAPPSEHFPQTAIGVTWTSRPLRTEEMESAVQKVGYIDNGLLL
jgi:hypothetical protein